MKYIKSSTLLVAWLVVTALCTSPVVLAGGTMKMASATINDVQHQWQKVFSQELAGRIGDEINVEIYPANWVRFHRWQKASFSARLNRLFHPLRFLFHQIQSLRSTTHRVFLTRPSTWEGQYTTQRTEMYWRK